MTYVVLEAGATHQGFESCKRIIDACAEAKADAVKFQSVFADDLLLPDSGIRIKYGGGENERAEDVYVALKRGELSWNQWTALCEYTHKRDLAFISAPSSFGGYVRLRQMGADGIKITKGDQNHRLMIRQIANDLGGGGKGWPEIYLDGREAINEVAWAHGLFRGIECRITIMHCPSGYPTPSAGVHLAALPVLLRAFPDAEVGYADHSLGTTLCYAAIGLGADTVEKTVTEDKTLDRVEHAMSLELREIAPFVKSIHEIDAAMGDPAIIFSSRVNPDVRRGIYAARDIEVREDIGLDDLAFLRPEGSISADKYEEVVGRFAICGIKKGQRIDRYVVS